MRQDTKHPFFRPLWRRVAIVAVCLVWSGVEWAHGETVWGFLTLALAAYGIWAFFIDYDPGDEPPASGRPS